MKLRIIDQTAHQAKISSSISSLREGGYQSNPNQSPVISPARSRNGVDPRLNDSAITVESYASRNRETIMSTTSLPSTTSRQDQNGSLLSATTATTIDAIQRKIQNSMKT